MVGLFTPDVVQNSQKQTERVVRQTLEQIFPIKGLKNTLRMTDLEFGSHPALFDFERQKELKLKGQSLAVSVFGTFELVDNQTNKVLNKERVNLMRIPVLTPRGSFLVDGNEYQAVNQLRLRSGTYTRKRNNDEYETQVNTETGWNFRVLLRPESGHFYINVRSNNILLYPFLKGLGISDQFISQHIGSKLTQINREAHEHKVEQEMRKFVKAYHLRPEAQTIAGYRKVIEEEFFTKTRMDANTVKMTLGKPFSTVNAEMILRAAQKLRAVMRGEAEEDDRDSLEFKKFLTYDDHIAERIMDSQKTLEYKIRSNIDGATSVKQLISPGDLNTPVRSFFTSSSLSGTTEQTNPLTMLGDFSKVTIMGEGGVKTDREITNAMRDINPSTLGFLDPVHTPESEKIGALLHLSQQAIKRGDTLVTKVYDVKKGGTAEITPRELVYSVVAFPGQYDQKKKTFKTQNVKVMANKRVQTVSPDKVDYAMMSPRAMFGTSTNLIPFLQNDQGNRAMMAAKMQEQAISLKEREAPLVQSAIAQNQTYEKVLGESQAIVAPSDGTIVSLKPLRIKLTTGKVVDFPTYEHFPLTGGSFLNHTPKTNLQIGMKVKKGQVLADSNFTSNGQFALGVNLSVAFMPYKGLTFEDGIVISDAAASKLTSEHLYLEEFEVTEEHKLDKREFAKYAPYEATFPRMNKLNDKGIVKKGTILEPGDIIIAALRKVEDTEEERYRRALGKHLKRDWRSASLTWEKDVNGTVIDVVEHASMIRITIKTNEPAKAGDKIVGRHGNKGTIAKVIPISEMPKTEDGTEIDIILNPISVPSRMNIGQLLESSASLIAEKTGKPFVVDNFSGENYLEKIKKEMKRLGIKDKHKIIDPEVGELENPVFVGKQYMLKLQHQTEKKFSARGQGPYTLEEQPARGGSQSGQALDILTNYTLLAHGAKENLREMSIIKGQRNDEFWREFRAGRPTPPPPTPFVFDKFINNLRALGVSVHQDENKFQLMAMTDKEIESMSSGKIEDARLLKAPNLAPEKGGLFDPKVTGGPGGSKWSHIELAEPIPNPVFKEAIVSLLDLTTKEFEGIIDGTKKINEKTGGQALEDALSKINVKRELDEAKKLAASGEIRSKQRLDKLHKRIRFLDALERTNRKPTDYILHKVPVLPPKFRPIYPVGNNISVSDVNELYQHLTLLNMSLEFDKDSFLLDDKGKGETRKEVYSALSALQGISDPVTRDAVVRRRRGILRQIGGGAVGKDSSSNVQPKDAFFQGKLVKRRQDLSGRGVIAVGPELGVDEVGLPKLMAWEIFEHHLIRDLVQTQGLSVSQARAEVENKTKLAEQVLHRVADKTPVILNRAPSLHKFSTMAFKPKLIDGKTIRIPSLVTKGLNADFDGDCSINSVFARFRGVDIHASCDIIRSGGGEMPHNGSIRTRTELVNLAEFPRTELIETKGNVEYYRVPEGVEVLTVRDGEIQWLKPDMFSVHKDLEMVEVETNTSRTVHCSTDHSLITVDEELNYIDHAPKTGLTIPRLRKAISENEGYELLGLIALPKAEEAKYVFQNEILLDFKFGYLNGIYVGDGWTNTAKGKENALSLASDSYEVSDEVKRIASSYCNQEVHISSVESPHDFDGHESFSIKHTWHSSRFAEYFRRAIGHGAHNKHLPPFWTQSPESFRWGLLSGLIDTDGSVAKNKRQTNLSYTTVSRRLAYEIVALGHSLDLTCTVNISQTPRGEECYNVLFTQESIARMQQKLLLQTPKKAERLAKYKPGKDYKRNKYTPKLSAERLREIRDLVGCPRLKNKSGKPTTTDPDQIRKIKERQSLYQILRRVEMQDTAVTRPTALDLFELLPELFENDPFWNKWKTMVLDERIEWELVTKIKPLPFITEAYDLTIPPVYTMVTEAGFVVFDTMAVHVPVTEKAKEEALKKMLPSQNLFRPGYGTFMLEPSHEQVLGLYFLTQPPTPGRPSQGKFGSEKEVIRTFEKNKLDAQRKRKKFDWRTNDPILLKGQKVTLGKVLVNQHLPDKVKDYNSVFDGKYLKSFFNRIKEQGVRDSQLVEIASAFKDLGNDYAYKRGFTISLDDITVSTATRDKIFGETEKKLGKNYTPEEFAEAFSEAEKKITEAIVKENPDNAFTHMSVSGARGNWGNLRQILGAPVMLMDNQNRIVPVPVKQSYSEGLDTADYWIAMFGARKGMVDRARSTAAPGAFTKVLINNTLDHLVTMRDCRTQNGLVKSTADHYIHNRYLAQDVRTSTNKVLARRNDLITQKLKRDFQKEGITTIVVRSPLNCDAKDGLCAKCFGVMPDGKEPEIGDNIGVIAGHTLTEPTTQMAMDSFHSGGIASNEVQKAQGLPRVEQLFQIPDNLPGKATISKTDGAVTKITKSLTGGHNVFVDNTKHFVGIGRKPIVNVGDKVQKGDRLSDGVIKPQELLELKGMQAVREYMTNELSETYKNAVHHNILETVVQKVTNLTKVEDPGDSKEVLPGEFVPLSVVENLNRKGANVKHKPQLKSINELPHYRLDDWMAKMNLNRLSRAVREGAQFGQASKYKDTTHPIPAFVYGKHFGETKETY